MNFELKTDAEGTETIEETITTEHTTRKIWDKTELGQEIAKIDAEILELQARKAILEEQL